MIFLATPVWRFFDIRTATAILVVVVNGKERIRWEIGEGSALISRVRSRLATIMLESEADTLVFIDDDIQFNPEDFWKIVEGSREKNSVYGGVYMTRSNAPRPAVRPLSDELNIRVSEIRDPVEVTYLSGGFMAIPRGLLEEMKGGTFKDVDGEHHIHYCDHDKTYPFWNFFAPFVVKQPEGGLEYLSEDWAFCERAKQLGYKIWADASIWLGHRGIVTLTPMDAFIEGHSRSADGVPSEMEFSTEYQGKVNL